VKERVLEFLGFVAFHPFPFAIGTHSEVPICRPKGMVLVS